MINYRITHKSGVLIVLVLITILISIIVFQSTISGKTWRQLFRSDNKQTEKVEIRAESDPSIAVKFLFPISIGNDLSEPPHISHIQAVDFDQDSLLDVIFCDIVKNNLQWIRQNPAGVFTEIPISDNLFAPSHLHPVDFDKDGDMDLVVSLLGLLYPTMDKIGAVVIFENDGEMQFTRHDILENTTRVSDARAGDLDNDGDLDILAVQFGYVDGETRWMENLGNWEFRSHIIQSLAGGIHGELVDIDNDKDLDIITLISQQWEEIYLFVNDGKGQFNSILINGITNPDFGSSGIYLSDLDQDKDIDILYTNGDAFDYRPPIPRPWHGVNWVENKGNYRFEYHRITNFGGAFNARPLDVDNDNDLDVFVVSTFNQWDIPESQSFIWLENDGNMNFERHDIANSPTHILPLELGDYNNDGQIDFITGGMHAYPPYDRMARVSLWYNNWTEIAGDR